MNSKRLKEKAKKSIFKITLIEIIILRLLKTFDKKQIIICTTSLQSNNYFKKIALKYKIKLFLGSNKNIFKRIHFIGINDCFIESGSVPDLERKYKLSSKDIFKKIKKILN